MILQTYLDKKINQLCPIHGISFGNLDDKQTWKIYFKTEATDIQKQAAQNVIDNFVWDQAIQDEALLMHMVDKFKDDLLYIKEFKDYKDKNPTATFKDFIIYLRSINI